jgi:hypothetical protein
MSFGVTVTSYENSLSMANKRNRELSLVKSSTAPYAVLPRLDWSRADFKLCGLFRIWLGWPQATNQKPRLRQAVTNFF